ncbi:hypothetical protein SGPA1_30084 [Streptomyces misionensis JCM 4497]
MRSAGPRADDASPSPVGDALQRPPIGRTARRLRTLSLSRLRSAAALPRGVCVAGQ